MSRSAPGQAAAPRGPLARAVAASSCPVLLFAGDVRAVLRRLPAASVRCVVTSPPYWGLRDYGIPGQIGLERTPEEWADGLVKVFRQVRRVLRPDGTLWLNLGDAYASGGRGIIGERSTLEGSRRNQEQSRLGVHRLGRKRPAMYKSKDLLALPWTLALALRADGWTLRADIIWHKPNPMPESVQDRPTRAHEYVFLFSQRRHYYYDAAALAEPLAPASVARIRQLTFDRQVGGPKDYQAGNGRPRSRNRSARKALENLKRSRVPAGWDQQHTGARSGRYTSGNKARKGGDDAGRPGSHLGRSVPWEDENGMRNARTVWTLPVQPFSGAHFATFPLELARRCVLAGSAPGDTVMDPFGGRGTVARAALEAGRCAWHVDLGYHDLAREYILQGTPLMAPMVEVLSL